MYDIEEIAKYYFGLYWTSDAAINAMLDEFPQDIEGQKQFCYDVASEIKKLFNQK